MATTEKNLYQKLLAITEEIGKIDKTGTNTMQGYKFIEQAQVVAEVRVQLAKHGVMIIPETVSRELERHEVTRSNGKPGVDVHARVASRYTLVNADNPDEKMICEWDAGEAIDSGDKATNKATTASHKYFLMKLFNISDKDDPDAESPVAAKAPKPPGYVPDRPEPPVEPPIPPGMRLTGYSTPQGDNMDEPTPEYEPIEPAPTIDAEQMAELMHLAKLKNGYTVKKEAVAFLDMQAGIFGLPFFTHLPVKDFEAFKRQVIEAGWKK